MDKKFVAWLLITTSLFMIWYSLRLRFLPPEPPPSDRATELGKGPDGGDSLASQPAGSSEISEADRQKATEAALAIVPRWHVLGSLDPKAGFRQMVYLSNRGASIERIELTDQTKPGKYRFRSLEAMDAYIGYLGMVEVSGGLKVGCVPPSSPAELAKPQQEGWEPGLQVGDILLEIDHQPMDSMAAWYRYFAKAKPGREALIEVRRTVDGEERTGRFTTQLTQAPLDVVRVVDDAITEDVVGNVLRNSCLTTLAQIDAARIMSGKEHIQGLEQILNGYWESHPLEMDSGMGVEFTLALAPWLKAAGIDANLELVKRYRVKPVSAEEAKDRWAGYGIDMEVLVRNLGDKPTQVAIRQESLNGLTLEGWWYLTKIGQAMFGGTGARDIVYASTAKGHQLISRPSIFKEVAAAPNDPSRLFLSQHLSEPQRDLKYIGIDGAFFAATVMPLGEDTSMKNIAQAATVSLADSKMLGSKQQASNVSAWFDTSPVTIEAKQEKAYRFRIFAGPKAPELLAQNGLGNLIEYGWFGWVAIPLTWILHTFFAISNNFGIAIVMLTVMVRSLMFPISRRAAISAQKMQALSPEMKKITEMYKDDLMARNKAMQELYRKANFQPLAGCLPLFIQIPIFIGLYRAVSVDVELRQQPLIPGLDWCSNLGGPDMLLAWSTWMPDVIAGKGSGWFGPYFNLLPIITITLFIIQQKILMPKAQDEQQQATQTMMMYMTVFMGVLFFKVPAGLCIYFITSSTWSLVERRLIKKFVPPMDMNSSESLALANPKGSDTNARNSGSNPSGKSNKLPTKSSNKGKARPETLTDVMPWLEKYFDKSGKNTKAETGTEPPTPKPPTGGRPKKRK